MADPLFHGRFDPVYPCRRMPTRHCPAEFGGVCGERPCARFESDDETPWLAEAFADYPVGTTFVDPVTTVVFRITGPAMQTADDLQRDRPPQFDYVARDGGGRKVFVTREFIRDACRRSP